MIAFVRLHAQPVRRPVVRARLAAELVSVHADLSIDHLADLARHKRRALAALATCGQSDANILGAVVGTAARCAALLSGAGAAPADGSRFKGTSEERAAFPDAVVASNGSATWIAASLRFVNTGGAKDGLDVDGALEEHFGAHDFEARGGLPCAVDARHR